MLNLNKFNNNFPLYAVLDDNNLTVNPKMYTKISHEMENIIPNSSA